MEQVTTKTFHWKMLSKKKDTQCRPRSTARSAPARTSSGFTLLEILIVLAIIASMMTWGAGKIRKPDNNIKFIARKFSVLGKEIRNRARLQHVTYRLVLQMDGEHQRYWVEKAPGPLLIDPKTLYEKTDKKDKNQDDKKPKKPGFEVDKSFFKKEKELPPGMYFGSVETISQDSPRTDGEAYVHFFAEGLVESSAIQITDKKKLTWTILFNPITGQADIVPSAVSLRDARQ